MLLRGKKYFVLKSIVPRIVMQLEGNFSKNHPKHMKIKNIFKQKFKLFIGMINTWIGTGENVDLNGFMLEKLFILKAK